MKIYAPQAMSFSIKADATGQLNKLPRHSKVGQIEIAHCLGLEVQLRLFDIRKREEYVALLYCKSRSKTMNSDNSY